MEGWIKLHRRILENPIVMKDAEHLAVWLYLLLNASHSEQETVFAGKKIILKEGQLITGRNIIAEKTKVNSNKVFRILKMLKIEQQIEQQTSNKNSLITILNWDKYQSCEQQNETQVNSNRTAKRQKVNTNKNIKNEKNVISINNIYTHAFEKFWQLYPRKKDKGNAFKKFNARLASGFSEDELLQAVKNYADEVRKNAVPEKYIKHASTFLSDATPFVDYLDKNYVEPTDKNKTFEQRTYDYDDLEKKLLEARKLKSNKET